MKKMISVVLFLNGLYLIGQEVYSFFDGEPGHYFGDLAEGAWRELGPKN